MNDPGKASQYRLRATWAVQGSDGRKHRSQKSQALIVNALLELIAQGNLEPSADQIAEHAKVGRRSVFRHFRDMDTLYREIHASIAVSLGAIVEQPFQAADWRGRILELVDRRALGFEKLKPFLRAGQIHRHRSSYLKSAHAQFVAMLKGILLGLLPKSAAEDVVLVETLDMLLSFETWSRLRDVQGLSVTKSKRVLKHAIEPLLSDDPTRPAGTRAASPTAS